MDYLGEIGKQGILGLLLAASLALNFLLGRMLLDEKDKRIKSAEDVKEKLAVPIANIDRSLELIENKVMASKGGQ